MTGSSMERAVPGGSGVECDVLVVGGGNAALSAALSAAERGASVTVLERAPIRERGGNSAFTTGAMRVAYAGLEDLREFMPDLSGAEAAQADFGRYSREEFLGDMARVTEHRCNPDLAELLVDRSLPAVRWLHTKGVRFVPSFGHQAFSVGGRFRFWGGLVTEVSGGGVGLINALTDACGRAGIPILYDTRAIALLTDDAGVHGVRARSGGRTIELRAPSVVLGCGGFEANAQWRAQYLGPGWDLAKVRGTRFNTGDGIEMALDAGAASYGHWSGCHSVAWDLNAPEAGDLVVRDGYQKHSYPLGIVINARGERFLDEGADFRNYTYAKYGAEILRQPGQFAWQIFDSKVSKLLRDEYRIRQASKVSSGSLEGLVAQLDGVDSRRCLETIKNFNAAVDVSTPFDPSTRDGRGASGLTVPKSNWANKLDAPPFEAYAVTCGITFTFGGLRITPAAEVVDVGGHRIPGLYACGELVGGLFYFNYPGGTGLTSGTVFGRIAGVQAAARARGTGADKPPAGPV